MSRDERNVPTLSSDVVDRYVRKEVSMTPRMVYAALLTVDAGALILLSSLWWTEPSLPLRAHVVFAGLSAILVCWIGLFSWVLSQRRPLFALDRVIAGWMASVFTALFLVAGTGIAAMRGPWPSVLAVAIFGAALLALAVSMLLHAKSIRRALLTRKDALVAELATRSS